jgi:hypothetical protein
MTIFLKNYTSSVPVEQTIGRIERLLIRCQVSSISKEYGPTAGQVAAFHFTIQPSPQTPAIHIRLPIDVDRAQEALWLNYVDGDKLSADGTKLAWSSHRKKTKTHFRVQAERTAWRIVQDWLEIQLSMIQLNQADTLEVFLPYVWDGRTTVYNRIKESGYRALLTNNTEAS